MSDNDQKRISAQLDTLTIIVAVIGACIIGVLVLIAERM